MSASGKFRGRIALEPIERDSRFLGGTVTSVFLAITQSRDFVQGEDIEEEDQIERGQMDVLGGVMSG